MCGFQHNAQLEGAIGQRSGAKVLCLEIQDVDSFAGCSKENRGTTHLMIEGRVGSTKYVERCPVNGLFARRAVLVSVCR